LMGRRGSEYFLARLKRDHPDILERLAAGEFASVRQAAVVAGIIRPKAPIEKIRQLWKVLPPRERLALLRELMLDTVRPELAARRYLATRRKSRPLDEQIDEGRCLIVDEALRMMVHAVGSSSGANKNFVHARPR
jgi:hypothetical protein